MPEISIVVPVYNTEKFLHRCIESILLQTFEDYELILIDDGSQDGSGAICDQYAKVDKRIKVFHQTNGGVSRARNNAILKAKTEWISFVDSDDWLAPRCIERMYAALTETGADMCVSSVIRTNDSSCQKEYMDTTRTLYSGKEALLALGRENDERYRSVLGKMVKKDLAIKNLFPDGRSWSEDTAVVYKWLYYASQVVTINDRLYYYYYNPEGTTVKIDTISRLGIINTYEEMLSFFRLKGYSQLERQFIHLYAENLAFLYFSIGNNRIKRKLKSKMSHLLFAKETKSLFSLRLNPYYYEVLFPKLMRIYWYIVKKTHK